MATPALSANPGSGPSGGSREQALPGSGSESGRILPLPATSATSRSRHEFAQPDPTNRATMAGLWLSSCACRTAAPGLERKSQTHSAADAGGQSAVFAAAKVSSDHRLPTRAADLPECRRGNGTDGHRSALGGRHHLHPLASGVRVFSGSAGCLFSALHRLGPAAQLGGSTGPGGLVHGTDATASRAWVGA